jgi:type II secretory pathway component GspD/PulD (secretin)
MTETTKIHQPGLVRAALAALLILPVAGLQALTVGRISVGDEGGRRVLSVETAGQADPRLEQPSGRLVIIIPGGKRAMKTLKVGSDPVKQIRFGAQGSDLRVVLDLSRAVKASLGEAGPKGFSVDLGAAGKSSAKAPAVPAASAAAEEAADAALDPAQAGYTYSIVDLALAGDEEHSELVISANGPASYKPSVRENGKLISLSFRNSSLAFSGDLARLKDNAIEGVSVHQANSGGEAQVKVDVHLTKKLDYSLQRDQNQLVLRLERPQAELKAPKQGDLDTPVSLDVQNADLVGVLKTLADQSGFEYQFTKTILGMSPPDNLITAKIEKRPLREVLDTLLAQVTGSYLRQGNTLYIGADAEIIARRDKLSKLTRSYAPKYMTAQNMLDVLAIAYKRDTAMTSRMNGTVALDPRDKSRVVLNGTAEDMAEWFATMARLDQPEQGDAAASDDEGGGAVKTQIFHLQYLDATNNSDLIMKSIAQLYVDPTQAPTPYLDTATRTLVVTTKLSYLRKIEKLLSRLDVRPPQVNIEGRIVEVDQSVANQMGIDWTANQVNGGNPSLSGNFDAGVSTDFLSKLTLSTLQNGFDINAHIQALVDEKKADLVSAPNITVNDNQQAKIETKDNVVVFKITQTITNGLQQTTTESTNFEIPLSLIVTPKISVSDRRVAMKITFNLKTATGASPGFGAPPPTSEQTADTNVNVNSGDTAVIGGLVRQNNLNNQRKVPVLGDIPLLGMLFRFDSDTKDKKEVIIFITPSIVED